MNEDAPSKPAGKVTRSTIPSAAEESLSEALTGLEQILEGRRRMPTEVSEEAPEPGPDAASSPGPASDGQYTIPLLHDVVVPGTELPEAHDGPPQMAEEEETEAYRKLAERLANEIEVIVQARVEAAVQKAAEDIREQVRNHLEIMLPEIIEDLKVLGRRHGG